MKKIKYKKKMKIAHNNREYKIYLFMNHDIEDKKIHCYNDYWRSRPYRNWKYYKRRKKQWVR